ncbi:HAD family hydrolase [Candidatus Bathyarchaeota archaeon]|nr:HAD family hydrolase [Candidatus Bathyarchaeota archaeon]
MENEKLKVKGILLDLDGTIVNSKEAYREAITTAFKKFGQTIVDEEIVMEIPKRLEQNLPIEEKLKGIGVKNFLRVYLETYYQATITKTKPFPNISETLEKLSEKAKLALITMRYVPKETVVHELEKFGIAEYFQSIITALDTDAPKPSPEALIKCAMQLDVKMCDCAVVGDSVADVRAGKNAGIKTVAVLSGIFSRKELQKEKPDLILESVSQLPDFIE